MIILDTNVISELMRPTPSRRVMRWVSAQPDPSLFTTAITEAELLLGVALLPTGKRRDALEGVVRTIFTEDLEGHVLPFDSTVTDYFAEIVASRRRAGRPISHADAQIAAIARCHGATIATRNTCDFEDCGVELLDPWSSSTP